MSPFGLFVILIFSRLGLCFILLKGNSINHGLLASKITRDTPLYAKEPRTVITGVQPTGHLHIGNYIGCIEPFLKLQEGDDQLNFMIADLHATTGEAIEPEVLKANVKQTVALILACGIDPDRTNIYLQSSIPEILRYKWLLGTLLTTGRYLKISYFKRRKIDIKNDNVATFLYPLLMAADIFSCRAVGVVAGRDQNIHVTVAREIAHKLNNRIAYDLLQLPQLISEVGHTITSLDGSGKMSKSNPKDETRINMLDNSATVEDKIKAAKTGSSLNWGDLPRHVTSLLRLYSRFVGKPIGKECLDEFASIKPQLSTGINEFLVPIQERYERYISNERLVNDALAKGSTRVKKVASDSYREVSNALGISYMP